jgi:hypothetical protein
MSRKFTIDRERTKKERSVVNRKTPITGREKVIEFNFDESEIS